MEVCGLNYEFDSNVIYIWKFRWASPKLDEPKFNFGMASVVFFICLSFISYEENNCLKLNLLGSLRFWHRPSADVLVSLCV